MKNLQTLLAQRHSSITMTSLAMKTRVGLHADWGRNRFLVLPSQSAHGMGKCIPKPKKKTSHAHLS